MKSRPPDSRIKEAVKLYKKGDEKSYTLLIEMLSNFIYNYPRVAFGMSVDTCGDFFEYVLTRMKAILNGYRETDVKFITWFTVVLRNRYLNFVRGKKLKNRVEEQGGAVSFDYGYESNQSLHNFIGDGKNYGEFLKFDRLINEIIIDLKEKHRLFFHLYFIETIRPEDISFISIYLDKSFRESLNGISVIRNTMLEKYRLKNKLFQRLNDLYYGILKSQEENNKIEVEKLKKKRNKVLDEYKRVKLTPSYESLSQFLGFPIGTVSTGIMRTKSAVQNFLKERYDEEMPF
ncbi:MAG TPA: sigma-70 family RNA polymerase sigma factor [Spirochaetes bacterium]|nr:sigma-70 family RNA polymerase sigma factor [Spirochaetota bacterium]